MTYICISFMCFGSGRRQGDKVIDYLAIANPSKMTHRERASGALRAVWESSFLVAPDRIFLWFPMVSYGFLWFPMVSYGLGWAGSLPKGTFRAKAHSARSSIINTFIMYIIHYICIMYSIFIWFILYCLYSFYFLPFITHLLYSFHIYI